VVDRRRCRSERAGGEEMDSVVNQPESVEYYRFDRGCFRLSCPATSSGRLMNYVFDRVDNHLNDWLRSIQLTSSHHNDDDAAAAATLDNVDRLVTLNTASNYPRAAPGFFERVGQL